MMKKCRVFVAILGVFACVGVGRADEDSAAAKLTRIGAVAWDQANLATLQSFGYADVAEFLGAQGVEWGADDIDTADCPPRICANFHIQEFTWANLNGDGLYSLVAVLQDEGTSGENRLIVSNRSSSGAISSQTIVGQVIRLKGLPEFYIPEVMEDLNGGGEDELVIPTEILQGRYASALWPAVYRIQDGAYVESSRNFAPFYDTRVLPKITVALQRANLDSAHYSAASEEREEILQREMMLIITRDKILRVIGRDPDAVLAQARIWTKGSESEAYAEYVVLKDMGGHQQDLEAAELKAFPRGMHRN